VANAEIAVFHIESFGLKPSRSGWSRWRTGVVAVSRTGWDAGLLDTATGGVYTVDIRFHGRTMTELRISRWGNSSGIRLPKAVMDELGLKPGETVNLTVKDGKGVIEPKRPRKITLEWIISETKRLGRENAPEMVDWGADRPGERIDDAYSRGEITEDDTEVR